MAEFVNGLRRADRPLADGRTEVRLYGVDADGKRAWGVGAHAIGAKALTAALADVEAKGVVPPPEGEG